MCNNYSYQHSKKEKKAEKILIAHPNKVSTLSTMFNHKEETKPRMNKEKEKEKTVLCNSTCNYVCPTQLLQVSYKFMIHILLQLL